jgi:hypothetical protein
MRPITPNIVEQANGLRAYNASWRSIALALDVSEWAIRCAIDPAYRSHRQMLKGQRPAPPRKPRPRVNNAVKHEVRGNPHGPPRDVLAERDLMRELLLQPRSLTAQLLGDPLPGRSALDQKTQNTEGRQNVYVAEKTVLGNGGVVPSGASKHTTSSTS